MIAIRCGGLKQPYTTGYITSTFHLIKQVFGGGHYEAICGRVGAVTELKDRTAAEVLTVEEACQSCINTAWTYHLLGEAKREEKE